MSITSQISVQPDLPAAAATIEAPVSIPTSAEVQAAFDPSEKFAGAITDLAAIAAGKTCIELVRFDWPNEEPMLGVRVHLPSGEGDGRCSVLMDTSDNRDPAEAIQRLTELATAASVAAERLVALTASGAWHLGSPDNSKESSDEFAGT